LILKRKLARPAGFEPTTPWFVAKYSIQLSYGRPTGILHDGARPETGAPETFCHTNFLCPVIPIAAGPLFDWTTHEVGKRSWNMKRLEIAAVTLATALAATALALPARANEHRGGGWHQEDHRASGGHPEGRFYGPERFYEGGHWHGGIEGFHEHDYHVWRGGHWAHDFHDGRYGWWWITGGLWYSYPAPIYPYPDPYLPPVVVASPEAAPAPAVPPVAQYWYYCDPAGGYYPYVPVCPSRWRVVPAAPVR
jgi:hypothetical protein